MARPNHQVAERYRETIANLVGKPVHLTITDNTRSMIHIRPSQSGYNVRLHHMFLQADPPVLKSLARFIRSRNRKAPAVLRDFVAANTEKIKKPSAKPRRIVLRPLGRYFDLSEVLERINSEYFDGTVDCSITWGANRRVRQQNSIRLGTYSETTVTIRVHPALDRSFVPKYVVEGIVYHEMLHHYLGVESCNGRRIAHSKAFRRLESRYRHYHKLQAWKQKNLQRLLGRYG